MATFTTLFLYVQLPKKPTKQTIMVTSIPELGVVSTHQKDASLSPNDGQRQQRSACSSSHQHTFMSTVNAVDRDVHVYTHPKDSLDEHAEEIEEEVMTH